MTLKNIEVFVDATAEGAQRADYAATLAEQCGAHLAGVYVVAASRPGHRSDYYVIGEKAIRSSRASERAADEIATSHVRRRFEEMSAKRDLRAEFRVIRRGGPDEDLILGSLHSDLVVIGQRELHELPGYLSPEKLLLASGAPILVVPTGWRGPPRGRRCAPLPGRSSLGDAIGCRSRQERRPTRRGARRRYRAISGASWRSRRSRAGVVARFCGRRHHPVACRSSRRGSDRHWRLQPRPLGRDGVRWRDADVAERVACSGADVTVIELRATPGKLR